MTDDKISENLSKSKRAEQDRRREALAKGALNRQIERERDAAFDIVIKSAQELLRTRAVLAAEIKESGGSAHIATGYAVLLAEIELVRDMGRFKLPEYPNPEYPNPEYPE